MKIGLLTLPFNNNYGGFLQEFALKTALNNLGHEVWFIDLKYPVYTNSIPKNIVDTFKNIIKKNILKTDIYSIIPGEDDRLNTIISWQYTRSFVDVYLSPKITPIHSSQDLKYLLKKIHFDAFVSGSDQIWRPKYMAHFIKTVYFDFLSNQNIKRISYAASFGTDNWEYPDKLSVECKALVKKFDAVSVREDSGVDFCKEKFDVKAQLVLDPTFLLTNDFYLSLIKEEHKVTSPGGLFCYILDNSDDKKKAINFISKDLKLQPFYIGNKDEVKKPVQSWLHSFHSADFIFTDSFHGMVFSIIFKKNFLVFGNIERGISRFLSLLKLLGLEDRLILNSNEISKALSLSSINYEVINTILDSQRNQSISYLKDSLK